MNEVLVPVDSTCKDELLDFLYPDVGNCLYLYMDIETYEIGGGVIDVWVQRDESQGIVLVAMRYSDSFQLYAREGMEDSVNYEALAELIKAHDAMRVSATEGLIQKLADQMDDSYEMSFGSVLEIRKYKKMKVDGVTIEEASREDIPEIAALIQADEELGQSYTVEELVHQFQSRYDANSGKSFIIKVDGVIVAHLSFSAITEKFVIEAYTIVRPEYRGFPYGAVLDSYVTNTIVPSMGKRAFAFMQEPRRIKLFELMGNPVVGKYGKLVRK